MILFTNWLKETFIGVWAKEKQTFTPGQSIWVENWKAKHYAKHLVTQYFNSTDEKTDHFTRKELEEKCISGKEEVGSNIESEIYNKNKEVPSKVPTETPPVNAPGIPEETVPSIPQPDSPPLPAEDKGGEKEFEDLNKKEDAK